MKKTTKRIIAVAGVLLLTLILSVAAILSGGTIKPAAVIITDLIVLLALSVYIMAFSLAESIKKTLYSYSNVGYIGGILFITMLLTSLVSHFVSNICTGTFSLRSVFEMLTDFPWQFAMISVPVLFIVTLMIGVSNIALIRHEGFRPKNLLSILLGAFYIGGTVAIWIASDLLEKFVFDISESKLHLVLNTFIPLFFVLMMCYFVCILVGCAIMGYAATRKEPAHDKDFVIVLGCSIDKRGGLLPLLKARTNRAIRFAWDQEIDTGKKCLYVPSGGQGPNEVMSEGSAMELYLLSHGAEENEVFPEKKSTDTLENMKFSKKVIDGLKPDAKIAFATTNFHVFRSGILARMAGIDAEGVSSKTKWYFWPNGFIREFFGILAINKKAHVRAAIATAVICTSLGIVSYLYM